MNGEISSMDGEMSSMNDSSIHRCHPWMTSTDEEEMTDMDGAFFKSLAHAQENVQTIDASGFGKTIGGL